jgi:hypothetical protein
VTYYFTGKGRYEPDPFFDPDNWSLQESGHSDGTIPGPSDDVIFPASLRNVRLGRHRKVLSVNNLTCLLEDRNAS